MKVATPLVLMITIAALCVSGCAALRMDSPGQTDSITGMSNIQKAVMMVTVWNSLYDDYLVQQSMSMSLSQKETMKVQYDILLESKPIFKLYGTFARTGQVPPAALETQVMSYLTRLLNFLKAKEVI